MFLVKKVSKKYGDEFALNDVSLTIAKGMNFIVGASGSGKTTLLKIISGMEQEFDGEVSYCGKEIKSLTADEKSYFYNNIFGFVWQDFNLLEESTVLENVLLPGYVKSTNNRKYAENALKSLKILDISNKKVKYLSGGQKQRVAIARELMKNPQVIIADEPTSALDEKTSKTTMDILRALSKNRTVIVVTHDTSLIAEKDNVYELDKGELISKPDVSSAKPAQMKLGNRTKLSLGNAFALAKMNAKNRCGRFAISALSLMVAGVLLLTTFSGTIAKSGNNEFDKLLEQYGEGILDISLAGSFMSAAGGPDQDKPNADVTQNLDGLYEQYVNDQRTSFVVSEMPFDNIKIKMSNQEYSITKSNNVPVINKLLAGEMPNDHANEIVVPESFVKNAGLTNETILGKELEFFGSLNNWNTGDPVSKDVKTKATVVGVIDTTEFFENEGEIMQFSIDDSFFFSKPAIEDMRKQAGLTNKSSNLLIRAKTPADMIAIKDELNQKGIVPVGSFELVEDMVRLETQTTEQSGFASVMIVLLSVLMILAIFLITGLMRRREYAIYKVSGFSGKSLHLLNFAETCGLAACSVALMLVTSPLLNSATKNLFGAQILDIKMLLTGALLILLLSAIAYLVTAVCSATTKAAVVLKAGDRQ